MWSNERSWVPVSASGAGVRIERRPPEQTAPRYRESPPSSSSRGSVTPGAAPGLPISIFPLVIANDVLYHIAGSNGGSVHQQQLGAQACQTPCSMGNWKTCASTESTGERLLCIHRTWAPFLRSMEGQWVVVIYSRATRRREQACSPGGALMSSSIERRSSRRHKNQGTKIRLEMQVEALHKLTAPFPAGQVLRTDFPYRRFGHFAGQHPSVFQRIL